MDRDNVIVVHHHVVHSLEAAVTTLHEVRLRARFRVSEAERFRSVQTWCSQLPRGRRQQG